MREGQAALRQCDASKRHLFPPPLSTTTLHTFVILTFQPLHQPPTPPCDWMPLKASDGVKAPLMSAYQQIYI